MRESSSDADVAMDTEDSAMISSPPRASRNNRNLHHHSRRQGGGGGNSVAHRLFADDDDDEDFRKSPILKPLDLNLDLNEANNEDHHQTKSKSDPSRKRHAEQVLEGRDLSFSDVEESPVDMYASPQMSPSAYKSPYRSTAHKSPSSFRTIDGRTVVSKNPFSPMLTEETTPPPTSKEAPPTSLNFPVSLDDRDSYQLHKRETSVEFMSGDGYPAKTGKFSFTGSPIREQPTTTHTSSSTATTSSTTATQPQHYNTHKLRRRSLEEDVAQAGAASQEELKNLQVQTSNLQYYNKYEDDISPTDVMEFPLIQSSIKSNMPPTPSKPRHHRRAVKRYTPVRKPPPNTPMPERRAKGRSFDEDDNDNKDSSVSRSSQSRFQSDFDVLGELGTGTFGSVLKVLSRLDGCMYAIKVAHRPAKGNADKDRMLKEVYALAALSDQADTATFHIVRYHQAWMEENRLYIQTEMCTTTLAAEMANASLTEQRRYKFLREICVALEFIHKNGMVHLDIKPENIFIKNDQFKLGDFGLVTKVSNHQDVEEGDSRYMSMELLSGDHADLTKSDIFSLGITLYEACLGGRRLPHSGPEWQALRSATIPVLSNTPKDMQMIIELMMNPIYNSRPTASELLKRPQLLSNEQKALMVERNKVIQANLALAEQTNRLRQLAPAPPVPSMPRKTVLVRANTWNGF